ncbi:lycopene cyclase domain-containing protein [Archangium sp.]|jgi:lycopene cyclase domain-containing protein|uniref:lycopene cyclase domain-containing protein n=1 Tax=Archangium sp. TaxID=1872627 RepID=UPI00389A71E5
MTYARFLGLFVVLPLLFLGVRYRRTLSWRGLAPMWLLLGVVYAATSPWDNLAVKWGLWGFDPERIWGIKLGYLPLEEYLFFGLQTLLVGLWARERLRRVLEPRLDAGEVAS